jgi:6-phosphogluconate dehydrogenase
MQLGLIGLGRMGANMRQRIRAGPATRSSATTATRPCATSPDLADGQEAERPAGRVDHGARRARRRGTRCQARPACSEGDLVIDGGNSRFTDDFANAETAGQKGIGYVDCGVSGGVWGLENGYGLMAAATKKWTARCRSSTRCGPRASATGFVHAGEVGAGHYAKMVHNGIEYGLMHAYAEGYELLGRRTSSPTCPAASRPGAEGTVVRSWLLDLLVDALEDEPAPGRRRRTTPPTPARAAGPSRRRSTTRVPMPVISASLFARFASRQPVSPGLASRRCAARAVRWARGDDGG